MTQTGTYRGSPAKTLTWDQQNRATQINTVATAYDPMNYRIRRINGSQGSDYYLEGEHLEAEYRNGALQHSYFRGISTDELVAGYDNTSGSKVAEIYHHDNLLSVTAVSDHEGNQRQGFQADSFGNTLNLTGTSTNTIRYAGRELDTSTGLYYYRARYYDPAIGRFISEDPKGFAAGVNFYAYCLNNPINCSDPSGLIQQYWLPGGKAPSAVINDGKLVTQNFAQTSSGNFIPVESGVNFSGYSKVVDKPTTLNFIDQAVSSHGGATIPGLGILDLAAGGCCAYNYKLTLNKENGGNALYDYSGTAYKSDYIGNMIFGGIAQNKGVSLGVSLFGSNIAQYLSTGTPDDPRDPAAITVGYTRNTVDDLVNSYNADQSNFLGFLPNAAEGGFVIYPNKPNNNMMGTVYSKGR